LRIIKNLFIFKGYNIWQSNLNDRIFDLVKEEKVPDVVSNLYIN